MHVCTFSSLLLNHLFCIEHAHKLNWAVSSWIVKYPQEIHRLSLHDADFEHYLQDLRNACSFYDRGQIKARFIIP